MANFQRLAETVDDSTYKDIFKIIADRESSVGLTTDSVKPLPLSPDQITQIQALTLGRVRDNMTMDSVPYQDLKTAREEAVSPLVQSLARNLTNDAYYNPVNGIGTTIDPSYYNSATTTVSMSPQEVTDYYSSGGVPGVIIDTKAGGMLVNGYRFLGNGWKPEWLERLKEYSDSLNFDQYLRDGNRDGLLYGGSLVVPAFKKDNALTYQMSFDQLVKNGILGKDTLKRFWTADRWNCVLVPDYNVSAEDYLDPKEIFVPITGYSVNTERAAVIRPRMLPYWGTIRQMGWGISEMESWIRPMLGLQIAWAAVPMMIQQLSVVYGHLPLDAILQAGGLNPAMALATEITNKIRSMSTVLPGVFNNSLELKTIERDFMGFPPLVNVLEDAVCSGAELSPTLVFNRQGAGFKNDDGESTLKLAASIQKIANRVIPQYQSVIRVMVYSCFGPDSEQAKMADAVRLDFDSPVVLTNEERNQAGTTFSTVVTAMGGLGLQPGDALEIGKAFIPDIELPQDVLDRLNVVADMGLENEGEPGFSDMLQTLHGDPVGQLTKKLNGNDAVDQLHDKLKPGVPSLLDKLGGGLKKMFAKKQTTDSDFVESEHPRASDGKFGSGGGVSHSAGPDLAVVNTPLKSRGDIDAQIDKWKAEQEKIKRGEMKENQANFKANKELAKTLYAERGPELMERMKGKVSDKELKEIFDGWIRNEPKKMILAISKLDKPNV